MATSKARLVLYAHGSGDPRWRQTFERLESDLQRELGETKVRLAYMEFAEPSLDDIAADSMREGYEVLRILPLFLAGGAHLANDLPEQVRAVSASHPGLEVEVLQPVGEDPRFLRLIRELVREAIV